MLRVGALMGVLGMASLVMADPAPSTNPASGDLEKIQGYCRIAYGHLAAAYCVVSKECDVCLATRSAATSPRASTSIT